MDNVSAILVKYRYKYFTRYENMLQECKYIPRPETDRLILRKLLPDDAENLRRWLGRDEIYTYRGRPAS